MSSISIVTPFALLPSCLRLLPALRLLLCVEHGCCYPMNHVDRHLRDQHLLPSVTQKPILQHLREASLTGSHDDLTTYPQDGTAAILGLPIHQEYSCHTSGCTFKTISQELIWRHCSKVHRQHSPCGQPKLQSRGVSPVTSPSYWKTVRLQTLWAETRWVRYFVVGSPDAAAVQGKEGLMVLEWELGVDCECEHEVRRSAIFCPSSLPKPSSMFDALERRFREAQAELTDGYRSLANITHKSEVTPWLRNTGYHAHLAQVNLAGLPDAYFLLAADDTGEMWLHSICHHTQLMLKRAMRLLTEEGGVHR